MKIINYIFVFHFSLLMQLGMSPRFYSTTLFQDQNHSNRILDNPAGNAVQATVRTEPYHPEIHLRPFIDSILCSKCEPIARYADCTHVDLNSPLRAFKFALGQFTADY
jgi:hypothetical protein